MLVPDFINAERSCFTTLKSLAGPQITIDLQLPEPKPEIPKFSVARDLKNQGKQDPEPVKTPKFSPEQIDTVVKDLLTELDYPPLDVRECAKCGLKFSTPEVSS